MSLIERALERLKQEEAARRRQPAVTGPTAEPTVGIPAATTSARVSEAASPQPEPLPCRRDLKVAVDLASLRAAGTLAPESEERRLAEEYRIIKRPLLKAMAQDGALHRRNLVAVTSALPGEGKTFTCINLALSLAMERGREVILVDGDAAKRHVTQIFKLDGQPGLLEAGGEEALDLEHTVVRTDVPSLFILPAGTPHSEATEILRSERTQRILATLASDPRRIVLIDLAPLLVTSEAGVLASVAGQVLLIVKASATPQGVVARAVESIAEDKPVSLILNQMLSAPERHYGYYYGGYGYGHAAYGSESDAASTKGGKA